MKTASLVLATLFSAGAWASATIDNQEIKISPARIERAIVVQAGAHDAAAIVLVQVDKGGSTDISAVVAPSKLVLGIFRQGEEFDVDLSFEIEDDVVSIKTWEYDPSAKILKITTIRRDERTVPYEMNYTLSLTDALDAAETATSEDVTTSIELHAYRP